MTAAPSAKPDRASEAPSTRSEARVIERLSPSASFALDVVRWTAAEIVVVGHAVRFAGVAPRLMPPRWVAMQEVAVAIFFLLSGYLITYTTIAKRNRDPGFGFRSFFVDRFTRIYSALVPALVFITAADAWMRWRDPSVYRHADSLTPSTFVANLFMLEGHPAAIVLPKFGLPSAPAVLAPLGSGRPLWSLAVEWWLYMAFGWLVLARTKERSRLRFYVPLAFFLVVPAFNSIAGHGHGVATAWFLGAIACLAMQGRHSSALREVSPVVSVVALVLAVARSFMVHGNAYDMCLVVLLGFALFFAIYGLQGSTHRPSERSVRVIRWLADYSFTLYLTHYTVIELVLLSNRRTSPMATVAICVLAANVIAIAIAVPTEMRHRAMNAWVRRRSGW
jgi:peptidoglycan/LPS O-acetylase OafA/YrhL